MIIDDIEWNEHFLKWLLDYMNAFSSFLEKTSVFKWILKVGLAPQNTHQRLGFKKMKIYYLWHM